MEQRKPSDDRCGLRRAVLGVLCGGALLALTSATGAGAPAARGVPAWKGIPALAAQLGPEIKINGYGIRPPRGYVLRQIQMQALLGNGLIYLWTGPMKADRTSATFTVMVGQDASGMMRGMNSASFVGLEMGSMTRTHRNATTSPIQKGTIHGLPFVRATWKGLGPRTGKTFEGFFYGQAVMPNLVMMQAKDEAPTSRTTIPLLNASALTLRKL